MEDIKTGKDDVAFVLVFKLSRFGRNAADVLNSLQTMQDFGVNLICVEDGINSSKEAGRLMISVLSAVAVHPSGLGAGGFACQEAYGQLLGGKALWYPVYSKVLEKERKKIAPEILRLTEELMK